MTMTHFTFSTVLNVVLSIAGLWVCLWGYRRSRRAGYLLIAATFVFGVVTAAVLPPLLNAINARQRKVWGEQHQRTPEEQKAFMEDSLAFTKRWYPTGTPPVVHAPRYLYFPLGGMLMVIGLWLLARREPRRDAESSTNNPAARGTGSG